MISKLIKDWPVRKGIVVKEGSLVELDEVYAEQMHKAGVIDQAPDANILSRKKYKAQKNEASLIEAAKAKEEQ